MSNLTNEITRFTDPFPIFEFTPDGEIKVYISLIKNKFYTELKIEGSDIRNRIGSRENPIYMCFPREELNKISKLFKLKTHDDEYILNYDGYILLIRGKKSNISIVLNTCSFTLADHEPWRYTSHDHIIWSDMHSIVSLNAIELTKITDNITDSAYAVLEITKDNAMRVYDNTLCRMKETTYSLSAIMLHWGFTVNLARWAIPVRYFRIMFPRSQMEKKYQMCVFSFGSSRSCHIRLKTQGISHTYIIYNCATEIA